MSDASNAVNPNSMSIIVTQGSLDWAYPPFILSTTAAAMDLPRDRSIERGRGQALCGESLRSI